MTEDEDDNGTTVQGKWKKRIGGYMTENDVDSRWVLYYENDPRPHGSLRIVSHPDLPPGRLNSFVSIITKRWPKNPNEINEVKTDQYGVQYPIYGLTEDEMEYYSVHENTQTWENSVSGTKQELEKLYGVKIFE